MAEAENMSSLLQIN